MIQYSAYIITYLDKQILGQIIQSQQFKYCNIFIDVRSVMPTFFNEKLLKLLVNDEETLRIFLSKTIYNVFKFLDFHYNLLLSTNITPRFFFFSDIGQSLYHLKINKDYKANRSYQFTILTEDEYMRAKNFVNALLLTLSKYLPKIPGVFYIHLNYLESDFVPYYVIQHFKFDNTFNVVLSNDKDLAQVCKFDNTYMLSLKAKIGKQLITKHNAIETLLIKQKMHTSLDASYIPLFLSIGGDSSDNIPGIKGVGYKKLYQLILLHKKDLDPMTNQQRLEFIKQLDPNDYTKKTISNTIKSIQDSYDFIKKNLCLTDFQIICDSLTSEHVKSIHSSISYDYKLDEGFIQQFIQDVKDVCGNDVYFPHIVRFMKEVNVT